MPPTNSRLAIHWISIAFLATMLIGSSLLFIVQAAKDEQTSNSHTHSTAATSSATSGQPQDEKLRSILASRVFSDFEAWSKKAGNANYSLNQVDIEKGRTLAVNRRALFKELMSLSPEAALERAIPSEVYRRMPASITTHLETPVSAYGDFMVYVVMLHENHQAPHVMTGSRIEREVVIGDSRYRALVYGRRQHITTKLNIPLQGITLDGVMVVDEDPVRRVAPTQYQALKVDRAKVARGEAVAEIGGQLTYFSSPFKLETFVRDQIQWEAAIGPTRPDPGEERSSWTEGTKTLLFIRVDFPDKPGEPIDFLNQPLTVSRAQNLISQEVSPFYESNSLNKTSFQTTVTPVVRMPQPQSAYFNNPFALFTDAENAARSAGFEPNNFNLNIFAMSHNPGFPYAGIALVGSRGSALNGVFDLRVTAHELGHNYGLLHANLWRTIAPSIIGPGFNVEYGNVFDVMGLGPDSRAHFAANYKRQLDWLTDANVQVITENGTYRVFAHDSATPGGIRALKIRKNADKNYWIEFRQLFTDVPTVMNGAIINWDYRNLNFRENQILDMTPTTDSVVDAPLQIGSVFHDQEDGIRITVMGKGNTTPQSLDVKVEFNHGCVFEPGQTSQNFTASGGEGSIPVTGCSPSATSTDSWLRVVSADGSSVRYLVAANYNSSPRTGTIIIAGKPFAVQQGGSNTACVLQPPGLVAWWPGEGNAADQIGINHGALVNSPKFAGGKLGGGFLGDFSTAGGYAEVPDSPSLTLTSSLTIEGWLKITAPFGYVIRRFNNSSSVRAYDVSVSDRITFTIWSNGNQETGVSSDPVPLGQFVHFAATLDDSSGQMSLYINGNLVRQSTTSSRPNVAPGATVRIGDINGITDELSVYNRALSASEIVSIYNAGNAGTGATGKCPASPTQITIQSNPVGRLVSIDGAPAVTTPQVMTWISGSAHTIATTTPQFGDFGKRFSWSNWSDGGAISHSVTGPAVNTTYTANFITEIFPTMELLMEDTGVPSAQAAALDAVLFIRDPFPVVSPVNLFNPGSDQNTRVLIFVGNLQLASGEPPSAVIVELVDSSSQTFSIPAESVWATPNSDFSQVSFRLPNTLAPGICGLSVRLHERISNGGSIRIKP